MAHTLETRTTFDELLKYEYGPSVVETVPERSVLMQALKPRLANMPFGGKSITIPVLYQAYGSVSSLAEGDSLPDSLPINIDNTVIPMYYHYFTVATTGQADATSQGSAAGWGTAMAQQIYVKTKAFRQHMNRQLCGDGQAILAQVDGSVSGQVITVDNAGGWSGFTNSDVNGARYLTANMYVQARNSSGTVHDAGLKISSVSTAGAFPSTSAAITVVGTCSSVADGDYLYTSATSTASTDAYGHEMPGIKLLIDDGNIASTVQSIDCSAYPEWKSKVKYGATRGTAEPLTSSRMMNVVNDIVAYGGGKVDFVCSSPGVWMTYGELADNTNTITNATSYDNGWPKLSFMGMDFLQDPDLPDEIFFIDTSALGMWEALPMGWIEHGGGSILRQVAGESGRKDAMEAVWRWYATLGITNRAKCGKLEDITVTAQEF